LYNGTARTITLVYITQATNISYWFFILTVLRQLHIIALPGPPIIVEAPKDAVEQGSPVTLRATSVGNDPNTQLVWYEDGREVDRTYAIQGPNVVNEHTFTADSRKPKATYEARVLHPRLPAPLRASTPVEVYGMLPSLLEYSLVSLNRFTLSCYGKFRKHTFAWNAHWSRISVEAATASFGGNDYMYLSSLFIVAPI